MSSIASAIRSWFVPDRSVTASRPSPTAGEILRRRIELAPAFELGRYAAICPHRGTDEMEEQRSRLFEALAEMHAVATSYEYGGSRYLHPIRVTMMAIDWLEMDYDSPDLGPISIGMPAVLDGRWIARNLPLMIEVAATAAIDSIREVAPEVEKRIAERMAKLARFGDAVMHAIRDNGGAHVTLHSPFGPAEVRQHDDTGSPYAVYRLPATEDFEDIPEGYEVQLTERSMAIRRCRSIAYRLYRDPATEDHWERVRFIDRGLLYFDPVPLPHPNPMPAVRRQALAALDGRRVLTVRWTGQDTFSLPMVDRADWLTKDQVADRFRPIIGTGTDDGEWLCSGRALSPSPDSPDVNVEIYRGTLTGTPDPVDGICEVHWLDIDRPDRAIDESMRHSLLPSIRRKLDRNP